jgi:septum formation protein
LRSAGFEFTVTSVQISEIPDENLNLEDGIRDISVRKALACLKMGNLLIGVPNLLLSADTVVILGDQILGKPKDQKENGQYLRRLSGQTHRVITAVCLVESWTGRKLVDHDESRILFRELTSQDIDSYLATRDGLDKAGGYGIQSPIASGFVSKLDGAFDNVMGLPIALVEKMLVLGGWDIERTMVGRK